MSKTGVHANINILLDPLPCAVAVQGSELPINTDYRTGIRFEQLVWDRTIDDRNRVVRGLLLYYREEDLPGTTDGLIGAYDAAIWFYRAGEPEQRRPTEGITAREKPQPKRIVDYGHDARYIYAAYLDQYGIDLQDAKNLHWWKFRALFAGLRDDHMITKIIGYRAANPASIKDKAERARIQRMQALYRIPDDMTTEERAEKAGSVFGGGA